MSNPTWKTYSIFDKQTGRRVWRGDAVNHDRALWAAGKDGVTVSAETHDVHEAGSYEEARAEGEAAAKVALDADTERAAAAHVDQANAAYLEN